MAQVIRRQGLRWPSLPTVIRMLLRIYELTERAEYSRSAMDCFTKPQTPRYTSVTREFYLGFGPGAASYTGSAWFANTFSIPEYLKCIDVGRLPVALGTHLTEREQKAWWTFWRLYDGALPLGRYRELFGTDFNADFRFLAALGRTSGLLRVREGRLVLTTLGRFLFGLVKRKSRLTYIDPMWGTLTRNAWPQGVEYSSRIPSRKAQTGHSRSSTNAAVTI